MKQYIHKPTIIHALKLRNFSTFEKEELEKLGVKHITYDPIEMVSLYSVKTLEGTMFAHTGDYIVKGSYGEIYPVKKEIFENIYERIDNETKT